MTADSQLISGKIIRAFPERNFSSRILRDKSKTKFLEAIDLGEPKRLFDIAFSLSVLILFAPVYLLIALLIFISSPGSVFYVQERVGKNRKSFRCLKFRTMVENADEMLIEMMEKSPVLRQEFEENFKLKKDPRITRIGQFLRVST